MTEGGLEAVSFRRIAAELGVSAPTLYWHVDSKRQLMDLMAEELLRRTGATPRAARSRARRGGSGCTATPAGCSTRWSPPGTHRGCSPATGRRRSRASPHLEQVLRRARRRRASSRIEAQQSLFAIGSYVIGSATEWQAEAERGQSQPLPLADDEAGATPCRAEALADQPAAARAPSTACWRLPHRVDFDHGLDLIIDGLRGATATDPAGRTASGQRTRRSSKATELGRGVGGDATVDGPGLHDRRAWRGEPAEPLPAAAGGRADRPTGRRHTPPGWCRAPRQRVERRRRRPPRPARQPVAVDVTAAPRKSAAWL